MIIQCWWCFANVVETKKMFASGKVPLSTQDIPSESVETTTSHHHTAFICDKCVKMLAETIQ